MQVKIPHTERVEHVLEYIVYHPMSEYVLVRHVSHCGARTHHGKSHIALCKGEREKVCVRVCVIEKETEREIEVCVCERERGRKSVCKRERQRSSVCVCVCVR